MKPVSQKRTTVRNLPVDRDMYLSSDYESLPEKDGAAFRLQVDERIICVSLRYVKRIYVAFDDESGTYCNAVDTVHGNTIYVTL